MSEAGVEPAKPASLAQYLCQFGYTDIWSPERESNPPEPGFKSVSYACSDIGRFWYLRPELNREIDVSETPAYAIPPRR